MNAWLKQNWKWLLLAVVGFVIVILLYLRSRGSGAGAASGAAPASQIVFPGNGAASTPSVTSSTPQGFFGLTENQPSGFPTSGYGTIPLFADPNNATSKILGWLPWSSQIEITGAPVQGRAAGSGTTTWYPVQWGGITGWINAEAFQSFVGSPSATDTTATTPPGQGGPGTLANLRQASLALQARSHRLGLPSRTAARLRADAVQAARESGRVLAESRGAAPVGGPLPSFRLRGRQR